MAAINFSFMHIALVQPERKEDDNYQSWAYNNFIDEKRSA